MSDADGASPHPQVTAVELRGPGITLEPLRVDHAEEMAAVLADESIYRYIGGHPPSVQDLHTRYEALVRGRSPDGEYAWLNWVIRDDPTSVAAGFVQATVGVEDGRCTADLAWVLDPTFQGRGLAKIAAASMVDFLRSRGVAVLLAHVNPEHGASQGVARWLGLRPTDELVDGEVRWRWIDGGP